MRKLALLFITIALISIVGCSLADKKSENISENENDISFSEVSESENSFVNTENKPTEKSTLSAEATLPDTSENVVKKVVKEPIISATTTIKNVSEDDNQSQNKALTEELSTAESTSVIAPETTIAAQEEQEFDVLYWLAYAQNYAQSIGLILDESAIDCWDNPISANAKNRNIGNDIESRLNRYKNIEGFTAVWIWAEKITNTQYEIYIGYA